MTTDDLRPPVTVDTDTLYQLYALLPREVREDQCQRCLGPNIVWYVPSPLWNEVMRGGDINGVEKFAGIVCPTCFAILAKTQGVATMWRLTAIDVRVPLQTVTPSGRVWNDTTQLWKEPDDPRADTSAERHVPLAADPPQSRV